MDQDYLTDEVLLKKKIKSSPIKMGKGRASQRKKDDHDGEQAKIQKDLLTRMPLQIEATKGRKEGKGLDSPIKFCNRFISLSRCHENIRIFVMLIELWHLLTLWASGVSYFLLVK